MPRDGSGAYTLPRDWTDDAAGDVAFSPEKFDEQDADIAAAINDLPNPDEILTWVDADTAAAAAPPGAMKELDGVIYVRGDTAEWVRVNDPTHAARTDNPHQVTKAQVGLGNVDNTSDVAKPVSTATQNALDTLAAAVASVGGTIESLNAMAGMQAFGALMFATKAAIDADLQHSANVGAWVYADPAAANNGVYVKSGAAGYGSWTRVGDLPYSVITLTVTGGTANAIIATSSLPMPQGERSAILLLTPTYDNTGATTVAINGGSALAISGQDGSAMAGGYLKAGTIMALVKSGSGLRTLNDFRIEALSEVATEAAADAVAAAAGVNMPGIYAGDARKLLVVKSDETGFGLKARRKRCLLAYGQSNIANTGAVAWSPRDNLMLWNGGYWNGALLESEALGDAFEPAPNGTVSVPLGWADHLAAIYPEDDLYLVVIARGGTGVKAVVGQRYTWSTGTSGDPGTGAIGGNNATPASITEIRYSETDDEGYIRFLGLSDLIVSPTYKARIEVVGDEENTWLEFAVTGTYSDNGSWRNQAVTYSGSANWPPANGTDVRLFESYPRMKDVLHDNITAAFDALGLTGADRKFDHILLWPTESDLNYVQAYEGVDFPRLLNELEDYYDIDAEWVFPLPFPYGAGIAQQLDSWWSSVRRIVAANEMRRVADLTDTGASNWTDANNIHVAAAGMLPIGRSIARNAERGGSPLNTLGSGSYTPTLTGVVNVDSLTPVACNWLQVGNQVVVSGQMAVNPTTAGNTLTQVRISLPVASDVWITTLVSGVATSMSLAGVIGWVTADIANDAAILNFKANSDANQNLMFSFQYVVVSA